MSAIYREFSTTHLIEEFTAIRDNDSMNLPHMLLAMDSEIRELSGFQITACVNSQMCSMTSL
jgi:hypothetical protein